MCIRDSINAEYGGRLSVYGAASCSSHLVARSPASFPQSSSSFAMTDSKSLLNDLDDMESAFHVRATRSVQQRPKSAGAVRRPVSSLTEMRSQRSTQQDSSAKRDAHASSLSALAEIRRRTAEKLHGGPKSSIPPRSKPRNVTSPKPSPVERERAAIPASDRPAAGMQRPKSAGMVRRTSVTQASDQSGLSRREQIALKKQQDAALDFRSRPARRQSRPPSRESSPPPGELSRSTVQQRPKSAGAVRRPLSASSGPAAARGRVGVGSLDLTDLNTSTGVRPKSCLLYTSPSPRDRTRSRMPSSA
eukprot:TRINITY_DN4100_c0_g1_i1.p1 TRINITY_DN4100_c0_g1~~TRINITY_DN4100_c0_g1_i1.p1  ORF type:complete len:304 (+),score=43.60 TRINITY_DN4100_c0_g1_i1:111-1022(+)